ncbi:glycoside hydrolase domain-containing protein [Streptomyces sp. NPDC005562]|uniref:glycoside hydrolase domain-containing protein n=1 Tax=Streptomyces sp. NPDC005562 TaxID=3154890 RepID=UPI00339E3023
MADELVKRAQRFINTTYGNGSTLGIPKLEENGRTSWTVMYALTRALQYEMGITSLSDSFGPATLGALGEKYGKLNDATIPSANFCRIIQSALYCKGYDGGEIDGKYNDRVKAAVSKMKTDSGSAIPYPDRNLWPKEVKGLFNMDAYVTIDNGSKGIHAIQQMLNGRYLLRKDFYLIPCDGHHSRDVAKSMLFAIQYELGMADGVANGVFGPGTQSGLKNHTVSTSSQPGVWVRLFSAAMELNKRPVTMTESFPGALEGAVREFQEFLKLPVTGKGDFQTWSSLLVSYGDQSRKGEACDGVTKITQARAQSLKSAGYKYIGRYLYNPFPNGDLKEKEIQPGELETIEQHGLRCFPIFQTFGRGVDSFSIGQGTADALAAVSAAEKHGFKSGSRIFFAVDYDAVDHEVTSHIIPHFEGINDGIESSGGKYRVGIYGPRNVCSRVSTRGLAEASFVSNMSSGFSGNLGYSMPTNWAYDQIKTISVGSGDGKIEIDNNVASGRDKGQSSFDPPPAPEKDLDVKFDHTWQDQFKKDVRAYMESVDVPESNWYNKWTTTECLEFVLSWDSVFTDLARRLRIRKALILIPVFWEMRHYNISKVLTVDDRYSDAAVYQYHTGQLPDWLPDVVLDSVRDSSTGLAQIFGATAINARNHAVDLGLLSAASRRDQAKDKELFEIWTKVRTNNQFTMATVPYVHMYHASLIDVARPGLTTSNADTEKILIRYQGTLDNEDAQREGRKRMGLYRLIDDKYYAPMRKYLG